MFEISDREPANRSPFCRFFTGSGKKDSYFASQMPTRRSKNGNVDAAGGRDGTVPPKSLRSRNGGATIPADREGAALRVGIGHDTHRLVEGRPLILGGVRIDHPRGLVGHSDADVVMHAVADALLGAAGLGDIGEHFPDTDPQWKGVDGGRSAGRRGRPRGPRGLAAGRTATSSSTPRSRSSVLIRTAMRANLAGLLGLDERRGQRESQDRRARRADRPGRGDRLRGGRAHEPKTTA